MTTEFEMTAAQGTETMATTSPIIGFDDLTIDDIPRVGGKNASLGEMIRHLKGSGVNVPAGFATTAQAYRDFLAQAGLDKKIAQRLAGLDIDDVDALAAAGRDIREWIMKTPLLPSLQAAVTSAYTELTTRIEGELSVAVRSSATAEDLPNASFAGQQETLLNISGLDHVLSAIKTVFASLYNDRAIAYREHQGFEHHDVALSVGIQQMVRSDIGCSGVAFSIDTESGFSDVVFITAAYGLGETVVQGAVNPDEFYVYKPALNAKRSAILRRHLGSKAIKMIYGDPNDTQRSVVTVDVDAAQRDRFTLTDADINLLAEYTVAIETHYGRPMDVEWAKDGVDGQLYIVQARPETVQSQTSKQVLERYQLNEQGTAVVTGRSIGQRIGSGKAKVISSIHDIARVQESDVLVTDMTDPDWEPVMKRAAAIVTNRGGRTCHAAIIARELGLPAIVGCGDATRAIKDGDSVTVDCSQGETGYVLEGTLDFSIHRMDIENMPELPVKIMLNVGNPERAFAFRSVPNSGVGLARVEFIISNTIGVHPQALLHYASLPEKTKTAIAKKVAAYASPVEYYIEKLREGIATIAAAFYPKPVIVRLSDFKSNEYANLLGGDLYEPQEENPMLGFRGASRYAADAFRDCFALECEAVKRVRQDMGLSNVEIMIPFVRTVQEAKGVIRVLEENGLKRGEHGLRVIMMCELPSNALLADEFLEYFDGFSIGSNDLTQLTLGLDRDSGLIADSFDERDPAVKKLLHLAIVACKKHQKYIGICGQGPSDHPDLAEWLLDEKIDSMSLNPDSVLTTILHLAHL